MLLPTGQMYVWEQLTAGLFRNRRFFGNPNEAMRLRSLAGREIRAIARISHYSIRHLTAALECRQIPEEVCGQRIVLIVPATRCVRSDETIRRAP